MSFQKASKIIFDSFIQWIVFNKTIIPLTLVGYEVKTANSALCASSAMYHLISNARSWNDC